MNTRTTTLCVMAAFLTALALAPSATALTWAATKEIGPAFLDGEGGTNGQGYYQKCKTSDPDCEPVHEGGCEPTVAVGCTYWDDGDCYQTGGYLYCSGGQQGCIVSVVQNCIVP